MIVKELTEIDSMHNLLTLKQLEVRNDLNKIEDEIEESEPEPSDSNAEHQEDEEVAIIR